MLWKSISFVIRQTKTNFQPIYFESNSGETRSPRTKEGDLKQELDLGERVRELAIVSFK